MTASTKARASLLTVAFFFLLIVSGITAADKSAPSQAGAKEKESARLEKVLGDFEKYAVKAMADWRVPGMAVAIVRGDDVVYQKAFGVKTLGKEDPVTEDTVFQIGSASKAFTSALTAILVDEGKLKWDDKVLSRLDDFKMYDPWVTGQFTVTDLMAQRSGMPPQAVDSLVMTGFGRDRVIESLQYVKPATSFRSAYAYQNNLWLVAAKIAEKITGDTWEDNIRRRILGPLGMSSSSTDMRSFTQGADTASLHRDVDGKVVAIPMDWKYMDWTYVYGPAGGINSNIKDMSKWLRMQARGGVFKGKRLIKEESSAFMHAPKTPIAGSADPCQYYCLGWVHREASPYPITWHNGGTSGSKTMVAFVTPGASRPAVGIAVLSNLIETQLPESLAWRFFDLYFGNPKRDWSGEALETAKKAAGKEEAARPEKPAVPEPALALDRYAGDYKNDIYGTVSVDKAEQGLTMTIGPKKVRIEMSHWDGNKFMGSWKYFPVKEDIGFITFDAGKDGAVTGMTADVFNGDGCGTFKRPSAAGRDRLVIDGMSVTREKISSPKSSAGTFEKLFAEAVSVNGTKPITYDQFQALRRSGDKFVLVDVLSADDYGTGHIPGAISFPLKKINPYEAVNKIPMGSNVVVYCLDFRCSYSDDAARKLSGYGYRVLAYKGGLDEWQQKGQKLSK
jgi:CubicO group peptidase (beta-lactamase class C family)/rhodanese-related sulfurtransferase